MDNMIRRPPTSEELKELRAIAAYQFGISGDDLIPPHVTLVLSKRTMRVRMLLLDNKKYLSLRAGDHRFNLHVPSGLVLNRLLPHPRLRVYVKDEYAEFIAKGGNLFARHALMADPLIRPNDEVLVVDSSGNLLAVGRAVMSGWELAYYKRGEAVRIREGISEV